MNRHPRQKTQAEYLERINRVIDYMNLNPTRKPLLRDLAEIAGFSEYHFHRIFQAMVGESLFQYQNKIRLANAAHKLLHRPDLTVTDIALESGFSGVSDFERSFKKRYRTAPSRYRNRTDSEKTEKRPILRAPSPLFKKAIESETRLRSLDSLNVAYIMQTGLSKSFRNPNIVEAYARLYTWVMNKGLLDDKTVILGMYPDNPEITPLSECRYYACISVPPGTKPEGEIGIVQLDSRGRYVTYTFTLRSPFFARRFFRIMMYLYGRWIPEHGYFPDNKPFLEIYNISGGKPAAMEFCIPVRAS
jgi:AraC family transcriptional regulator